VNSELSVGEIRELFPGTRELVYFNAAAQGLMPLSVSQRIAAVARRQTDRGIMAFLEGHGMIEEARALAARLVGCGPESIAFTSNTAEGIARIAEGLDWREGDEVVLCDLEFPANVYPWAAQRRKGVRLKFVKGEDGRCEAARYLEAIGPRTRVLAVSHVQFASGYRVDLEPLAAACREREILLFVDPIQSLGVCPLDVQGLGIGALALEGRKWLFGPQGSGLLYVAPEWVPRIRAFAVGVQSTQNPFDQMQYLQWIDADGQIDLEAAGRLLDGAGRYEAGFHNVIGLAGFGAALEVGEQIGRETIQRRIADLVAHCVARVEEAGFEIHGPRSAAERAGIVSFPVAGSADDLFHRLNADGYSVSVRDGRIRLAPHVYNTEEEVDRVVARIRELSR
jgi:selenocysteine lyase/cysteine desulfurase